MYNKKQHQLCCPMDKHSWCTTYGICATCAVYYGVFDFTPPLFVLTASKSTCYNVDLREQYED